MYPFEPEEGGELGLQVGDYVVVRQVKLIQSSNVLFN